MMFGAVLDHHDVRDVIHPNHFHKVYYTTDQFLQ